VNFSGRFNYLFRKYALLRAAIAVLFITVVLRTVYVVSNRTKPVPYIDSIVPPVGSPGDVVLINGKNFGSNRDMSYVEFAGSRLTASSYISWSDDCIKLVLPANIQDGLVVVGIKDMRSNPTLFANEVDIPVPVTTVQQITKPIITGLSSDKAAVGQTITITGNNFGDVKNQSKVLFTIDYNNKIKESGVKNFAYLTDSLISASEDDFDYVYWSNTEIKVNVPTGAYSGVVIIDTGKERSEPKEIVISENVGSRGYINKKIYLMSYSADIADVVCSDAATITLRAPIPYETAAQPDVEITDIVPVPALTNYQHDIIHQITKNKSSYLKNVFTQTFVLPVYEINTFVNEERVGTYKASTIQTYVNALKSDAITPSDNEEIIALSKKIIGRERNEYRKAKLIYKYMNQNFELSEKVRTGDSNPLDLLKSKKGDAYDFANIYTALLRACKIPCLTDCGILISKDLSSQPHWWNEFYIEGFGWIPVDLALAGGLEYKEWSEATVDKKIYYFGNLDSHHVVFSRGLNNLKPFTVDNKIVQQPRSFALQTIWEEASSNVSKYSSYWSLPVIKGVY